MKCFLFDCASPPSQRGDKPGYINVGGGRETSSAYGYFDEHQASVARANIALIQSAREFTVTSRRINVKEFAQNRDECFKRLLLLFGHPRPAVETHGIEKLTKQCGRQEKRDIKY
ncbi:hypothetical protein [Paraburkholderia gardini]|uniref:hypothetical protein n=1 Tax=Paraburkholderia gardini TaxID=2823469 RepID=UPI001E2E87BF|nr:hypothetical protein [Paraburkholderia gardini]